MEGMRCRYLINGRDMLRNTVQAYCSDDTSSKVVSFKSDKSMCGVCAPFVKHPVVTLLCLQRCVNIAERLFLYT